MSSVGRSVPINAASRYTRTSQKQNSQDNDNINESNFCNTGMSESYSEIHNTDMPLRTTKRTDYLKEQHKQSSNLSNSTDEEIPTVENFENEGSGTNQRPKSFICDSSFPYNLEGTFSKDGDVTTFVAKDLENKIRLSSPSTRDSPSHNSNSPSTSGLINKKFLSPKNLPQLDSNVLNDIEIEAQYLAASADNLIENLGNLLHNISSSTTDNVEVHRSVVTKLTDCMDMNIKIMYTIMAKTEEITQLMKPTEQLYQRIQQIKKFVDMLESNL